MRYAYLIPKEDAEAPRNTGRADPWEFQYDGSWHKIGRNHPLPEPLAEHAIRAFTKRPAEAEPIPLVDVEWFEGELELHPAPVQEFACPLCEATFRDYGALSAHVKECALEQAAPKERGKPEKGAEKELAAKGGG